MDLATQDQVLRQIADGELITYIWPELLQYLIRRIETISQTSFRTPILPPPGPSYMTALIPNSQPDTAVETQPDTQENGTPASSSTIAVMDSPRPVTGTGGPPSSSSTSSHALPDGLPFFSDNNNSVSEDKNPPSSTVYGSAGAGHGGHSPLPHPNGQPPPQIVSMVDEIIRAMRDGFPLYPPHTMQRLAELVVEPTRHYKHLVPYLHALDRVVHVTSGANLYPLPPAVPDMSALQFLNLGTSAALHCGTNLPAAIDHAAPNTAAVAGINWGNPTCTAPMDDSQLGGALLTPIPWLARQAEEAAQAAAAAAAAAVTRTSRVGASPPAAGGTPPGSQNSGGGGGGGIGAGGGEFRTESTETIDGPNGMGSIETVSINLNGLLPGVAPVMPAGVLVGASVATGTAGVASSRAGVTQGELLRQEQKAGVVPKTQLENLLSSPAVATAADNGGDGMEAALISVEERNNQKDAGRHYGGTSDKDEKHTPTRNVEDNDEDIPHARGPEEIGDADLGPQKLGIVGVDMHGIDVEAAVGRKALTPPLHPQSSNSHSTAPMGHGPGEDDPSDEDGASRALSPKREAEDELDGLVAKRAKTGADGASVTASAVDGGKGEQQGEKA